MRILRQHMGSFYLTTAIDYANGRPHLGHAYEKVLADVIARHRRLMGDDVLFLTGLDEHGQKVQQSARRAGLEPQAYVDGIAELFHDLLDRLHISHDDYIRTTEARHREVVQAQLQKLHDAGEIYRAEYRGFYSTRQEQFLQEKDRLPDGSWPEIFGEVTEITESNYFFRLARHQEWLVDHLRRNEDFIFPRHRQRQVLEFLREPLNDLCISRPRERLAWGIALPFDPGYVTYVWFDALLNYVSAVWTPSGPDPRWWGAAHHVIGKDILVPAHAVYWPVMLRALGLPLPRSILAHGWWLSAGAKLSKSTGRTVDPLSLIDHYGADAFRYFLIREMNVGQDSEFSEELYLARYTSELANDLGNLVNRVLNMTNRYAGGVVPAAPAEAPAPGTEEAVLRGEWEKVRGEFVRLADDYQFHAALERANGYVKAINRYAEVVQPWKLGKAVAAGGDPATRARLDGCLHHLAEALRLVVTLTEAVMPTVAPEVRRLLGGPGTGRSRRGPWQEELAWTGAAAGGRVAEAAILFPKPPRPEEVAAGAAAGVAPTPAGGR